MLNSPAARPTNQSPRLSSACHTCRPPHSLLCSTTPGENKASGSSQRALGATETWRPRPVSYKGRRCLWWADLPRAFLPSLGPPPPGPRTHRHHSDQHRKIVPSSHHVLAGRYKQCKQSQHLRPKPHTRLSPVLGDSWTYKTWPGLRYQCPPAALVINHLPAPEPLQWRHVRA